MLLNLSVVLCSSVNEKNVVHLSAETADVAASLLRSFCFCYIDSCRRSRLFVLGTHRLVQPHSDRRKTIQVEAFLDGSARFQTWNLGIPAASQSNMHFKPATNLIKGLCNHVFSYHIIQLYQAQPEPRMSENLADPCLPGTCLFYAGEGAKSCRDIISPRVRSVSYSTFTRST